MFDACFTAADEAEGSVTETMCQAAPGSEHRCCECRELILPGADYEYAEWREDDEDGQPVEDVPPDSVHRTCLVCVRVRDSLFRHGWIYGEMWERIHDEYCGEDDEDGDVCMCPRRGS